MKSFLLNVLGFVLLVGALAGAGFFLLRHTADPGFLIIGLAGWSVETSLAVGMISILILFVLLYWAVRILLSTVRLPGVLRQRGVSRRVQRSHDALIVGLVESAQGNWERAEKALIRNAANSGVPLVHYLTAARAASQRGASALRDEYLKTAAESMPDADLAVGLTRAELLLSENQFEEAINGLSHLNRIAPSHAQVLKLMHRAYTQLGDWDALRSLIPQLQSSKVLMEAEIRLLETETYCGLLKRRAGEKDAVAIKTLWGQMPRHVRRSLAVQTLYFAAMIEAGFGAEIEAELRQAVSQHWDQTLVVLYGCIELSGKAADDQIEAVRLWLRTHANDAVLLRVLGKMCVRGGVNERAEHYLRESLSIEASVEALHLLGDLYDRRGDKDKASDCYRRGLLLASSEVVKQVEGHPDGVSGEAFPAARAASELPAA